MYPFCKIKFLYFFIFYNEFFFSTRRHLDSSQYIVQVQALNQRIRYIGFFSNLWNLKNGNRYPKIIIQSQLHWKIRNFQLFHKHLLLQCRNSPYKENHWSSILHQINIYGRGKLFWCSLKSPWIYSIQMAINFYLFCVSSLL